MTQFNESMSMERTEESVDANVGAGISVQLRKFYSSIQNEEIPDRLLTLLEKLDEAERKAASRSSAGQMSDASSMEAGRVRHDF
ncbi:hypothetical protein SAMN05880593_11561 [Rhizobium sp. RU36D]|nr:hypothetical protein SAMN05880593_11561 [Rhizobium sp. RU36D]